METMTDRQETWTDGRAKLRPQEVGGININNKMTITFGEKECYIKGLN